MDIFSSVKNVTQAQTDISSQNIDINKNKQIINNKKMSDGIGNETYDAVIKVAEFLERVLPSTYPEVKKVDAEKAIVIIRNAAQIMKSDKAKEFTNVIKQYITATLGLKKMKKFKIIGPFIANKDVNIVFHYI